MAEGVRREDGDEGMSTPEERLTAARKQASEAIRRWETRQGTAWLASGVEDGTISAWTAMVEIHVLPAVATIDALCRLRVAEAEAQGRGG